MNKNDRKRLEKAIDLINEAMEIVTEIRDEEEGKFYNLTEGLQQTERGQKMEENVASLEDIASQLEMAAQEIDSVCQQ